MSIIGALPEVLAVEGERVALRERQAHALAVNGERRTKFQALMDRWRAGLADAAREGTEAPEPPVLDTAGDAVHHGLIGQFRQQENAIERRRTQAIVDAEAQIREEAQERVTAAYEEGRKHVEALRGCLDNVRSARSAIHELEASKMSLNPRRSGTATDSPPNLDVAALVQAIESGADLLAVRRGVDRLGMTTIREGPAIMKDVGDGEEMNPERRRTHLTSPPHRITNIRM